MKRFLILILALSILPASCSKKETEDETDTETEKKEDVVLERKYAKYQVSVRKDKDLKKWLITLEKAQPVDLLGLEEVTIKNNKIEIAKVRMTDGETVGYLPSRHLANKPVVVIDEAKIYTQNNKLSNVYATIPKGTIIFIIDEKMEWTKIYVGRAYDAKPEPGKKKKYIDNKWIEKSKYIDNMETLRAARDYEKALSIISSSKSSQDKIDEAKKTLTELSEDTSSLIGTLAKEKLAELENAPTKEEVPEEKSEDTVDETTEVEG